MRITENELVIPVLRCIIRAPSGFLTTSEIIKMLEDELAPEGEDAEILDGRNDTKFSQKVRNLVSHRATKTGLVGMGYALYDPRRRGFVITPAGRDRVLRAA